MKSFFKDMANKMSVFMASRYGPDALSKALSNLAIIILVASLFIRILSPVAVILLILCYFRIFSKNHGARQKELYAYLNIKRRVGSKIAFWKRRFKERETHKFFKCRKCKTNLRVPKGKGKIEITCKICGEKIIKRT